MEEYMKGIQKMDTPGGIQDMQVINESGLYFMIMRSNKPNAKLFQKAVYTDILSSIRKTGSFTLEKKYKFILENNRPLAQLLNSNIFDEEAKELERNFDWFKHSNCSIIYLAYIGSVDNCALVKLGYSDSKFDKRIAKHISTESQFEQFRLLESFEVSGNPVEDMIKDLLKSQRHPFKNQKEIFKTSTSLKDFVNTTRRLIDDNDYKFKFNILQQKYNELEKKNLELQLQLQLQIQKNTN